MKRVLFFCVGNSARSQIAEAYFNSLAGGRAFAESAGLSPADHVAEDAITVMLEEGIDMSSQSPKMLTKELIDRSDLIISMGCGNRCPAVNKPYLDWGVEDPFGKPIDYFRKIRDEIKGKVSELVSSQLGDGSVSRKQ